MRTSLLLLLSVTLLLAACKKDDTSDCDGGLSGNNNNQPSYVPLNQGNYWIYDRYSVNGSDITYSGQDSVVIAQDSLLNGFTYYQQQTYSGGGSLMETLLLRDSVGYLVTDQGLILFSSSDASIPLEFVVSDIPQVPFTITSYMYLVPQDVFVSAGSFACLEYISRIDTDEPPNDVPFPKYDRSYYASEVGRIKFIRNYFGGDFSILYELNNYHLE